MKFTLNLLYRKVNLVVLTVIISLSLSTNSQTITTSLKTEVTDVSDLDIGFNRRSDKGTWWTDNSFKTLVSEMNPDVVRYPGGTQANYWDWRTGKFLDNTDKTWNNKEVLKIPEFVNVLPNRTKIVYVVNMARPTPNTGISVTANEQTLKSTATLNLKIDDMISAINKFKEAGKMPFAVELGNEFYFGNEESGIFHIVENGGFYYSGWNAANNAPIKSNDKKEATVVNAKFYLQQCKTIVSKLKTEFPTLKFALTTTKEETNAAARERWNTTIFNELQNNSNFSALKNDIYAVTQHHYLNDKYGVQTVISDNSSSKVAISEGIKYPNDKISDYNLVPNNYKIWYTEFGEVKEIAEETWASAIRYGTFIYGWLSLGDKVGQLDWHYISDNNVVKIGSPMKLAPVGIAAKIVSKAFADMEQMQEINFTNNPISVSNVNSLYGLKFKNDKKETVLIINTSNSDFSQVDFNNLFSYSGQQKMTQYYSNVPHISNVSEGSSNIKSILANVTNSTSIKNFSLTVIESENTALSTDNELKDIISIYPNPVKDILIIQSKNEVKSVSIIDLSGKIILQVESFKDSQINLKSIKSGIYILTLETTKGFVHQKIVKL
ncbi:T9SS type A sorting domain-containing protein [Polaribacter sp. SA4-12]|uniref:T9SS type A sorting domain-containing protein n=1 Tax=Polaribacter sp. SA4-12 TaxID=1312072 RepID=UPI000B3D2A33|nr:T9SS type A sorting domain-containing protein [Polaribacter sp. SA4-12]ARV14853.1 hypothetical protein BTO07_06670 [Polaribacter sp. SA4-12]